MGAASRGDAVTIAVFEDCFNHSGPVIVARTS